MVESKRKKYHDKDKYYRLAKEQGLRSRAAFKLSQIHRTCPTVLSNVKYAVLDLCAAPGGWTQIVARTCPSHIAIVAVDVLPIRALPHHRNVTTIIGDITTDKCQADIRRALPSSNNSSKGSKSVGGVDVVLCDGAPNVGADYARDAYVQNELAVHAMKCASQHLIPGGTFITKVYRSRDYNALYWMLTQFFETVTVIKPTASRPTSAEIFLVCRNYKAPHHIDPKLLDPKHVFASIEDEDNNTEGRNNNNTNSGTINPAHTIGNGTNIFDKNWDKHQRKRGGYDLHHLDATMRHVEPVSQFVLGSTTSTTTVGAGGDKAAQNNSVAGLKDAIRMLSTCTGLEFNCSECKNSQAQSTDATSSTSCHCRFLWHHPFTTTEIKDCLADLQVLNKSDFKGLLTWRTKMQDAIATIQEDDDDDDDDEVGEADNNDNSVADGEEEDVESEDSEREEEEIQKEIAEMRLRRQREAKRQKKKERALAAKRRQRAALGMDLNAVDIAEHDPVFSLASIPSAAALDKIHEINLDRVTDEQLFGTGGLDADDADVVVGGIDDLDDNSDEDDDDDVNDEAAATRRRLKRERDLDEAYRQYLENTKNGVAVSGTKQAKRSKKALRHQVALEAEQDVEMAGTTTEGISFDATTYAKLLTRGGGSDDSDDDDDHDGTRSNDDDDDGFDADPVTPEEHAAALQAKKIVPPSSKTASKNPLIHTFADEPTSIKTARWFSNPLFAKIGQSVEAATSVRPRSGSDANDDNDVTEEAGSKSRKRKGRNEGSRKAHEDSDSKHLTAEDVLASMPKTDKQVRHEKRLKQMERQERKKVKLAKKIGDAESDFQQVAADNSNYESDDSDRDDGLSDAQKKRRKEAQELIKAGMGHSGGETASADKSRIEIVSQEETTTGGQNRLLPVMDDRKYDSEHEDYDSDDYAQTLALGTMLLRKSKEKAFVDASYNRYAWNDPADLPEWFVDDENKHYKPQLPIPPALLAKMKEKMMALSAKPIAKVAEARARKSKRAKMKLAAAKKQAEAVANSTEMSEAMKLKAISKALTRADGKSNKPGKQYVVAKKGRGNTGVKGAKVVDKRLKSDKRGVDRADRKRKKGKQNGLVGSKKRRHHR